MSARHQAWRDFLRALLAAAIIGSMGLVAGHQPPVFADSDVQSIQEVTSDTAGWNDAFLQYLVREGGAFAVVLVVLFFYRRDWVRLNDGLVAINGELVKIASQSVRAQTESTAAITQNTQATHRLARAVERENERRDLIDRLGPQA